MGSTDSYPLVASAEGMEGPLWIDEYAPGISDLLQENVRRYLQRAVDDPLNLVLYGPPGAGKTAAVLAHFLFRSSEEVRDVEFDQVALGVVVGLPGERADRRGLAGTWRTVQYEIEGIVDRSL